MKTIKSIIVPLVFVLVFVCYSSVAGADFTGDLLLRIARYAALEYLGAELSVDSITGNPIKGFSTGGITLTAKGSALLSADSLNLKINPRSLLSLKPVITAFSILSADIDGEKLAEHIASLGPLSGDRSITVQRADILNSTVTLGQNRADIERLGIFFSGDTVSADIDMKVNTFPIKGTAEIDLTGGAAVSSLSLRAGKGEIEAVGTIAPFLSVAGLINGLDIAELTSLWPGIPAGSVRGTLSLSFVGEGIWNAPLLSGDLHFEEGSLKGIPLERADARWSFSDNRLFFSPVDGIAGSVPLKGNFSMLFSPGKVPAAEGSFSGEGLDLQSISILFPAAKEIGGRIDTFAASASGPVNALSGTAELRSREITLFGIASSNAELTAEVTPTSAKLSGKAGILEGTSTFSGTVENYISAPKLNFTASVRSFNLRKAALLVQGLRIPLLSGTGNTDFTIKGTPDTPVVSGKIWSEKLSAGKENFISPSASFSYQRSQAVLPAASAQWRGARLAASGSIGPAGKLDLTASFEKLGAESIASLAPDIAAFKIKGTLQGKAVIKGTTSSPSISLGLSSSLLSIPGSLSLKNITATGTFPGGIKGLQRGDLNVALSAASGNWSGLSLSGIALKAKKTGRVVTLPSGSAKIGNGSLSVSGKATLPGKAGEEMILDLTIAFSGAELAKLSKVFGLPFPLGGTANGTASLKGRPSNPSFGVSASSPRASLKGITGTDITLQIAGTPAAFAISRFSAAFKGGSLSGTGTVRTGKNPDITLDIAGKNLDLRALAKDIPGTAALSLSGKGNGSFKGRIAGGNSRGNGVITSPSLAVGGLRATGFNYPFTLEGDILRGKNASLAFYGGKVTGSGTIHLKTLKFSHSAAFSGVDVNSAVQAFTGGLGGKVTGQAKGSLQVSGTFSPKYSLAGKGSASVSAGAVTGFRNVDVAARLYGTTGIRYARAVIPFRLETGRILLEKGTRADAPRNDPIYKFLTAQGSVGPRGALNLNCAGNINMKLFNALRGGAAGTLSGGSLEDALKGLLGGIRKGMAEEDFRDTTFTVRGTLDTPSVANVKTSAPPPKQQAAAPSPASPPQPPKPKKPEDILKEKLLESIFKK